MATACLHVASARPTRAVELADVFRVHGEAYVRSHRLDRAQRKVIRAIVTCRTPTLGGQCESCPQCGYTRYRYHSCRNRHCPKCQSLAKAQWLEDRKRELLPTPYFHNVFTLPPQWVRPEDRCRLLRVLRRKAWVVYSKRPFAGPGKLLNYFGRYTHRVAISNHRLW